MEQAPPPRTQWVPGGKALHGGRTPHPAQAVITLLRIRTIEAVRAEASQKQHSECSCANVHPENDGQYFSRPPPPKETRDMRQYPQNQSICLA